MNKAKHAGIGYKNRPWPPLPDEEDRSDISLSTQIVGTGKGLENANEVDDLIERGFQIYAVDVTTMEEDYLLTLVSLWKRKTKEEMDQVRFRSTTGMKTQGQ